MGVMARTKTLITTRRARSAADTGVDMVAMVIGNQLYDSKYLFNQALCQYANVQTNFPPFVSEWVWYMGNKIPKGHQQAVRLSTWGGIVITSDPHRPLRPDGVTQRGSHLQLSGTVLSRQICQGLVTPAASQGPVPISPRLVPQERSALRCLSNVLLVMSLQQTSPIRPSVNLPQGQTSGFLSLLGSQHHPVHGYSPSREVAVGSQRSSRSCW